MIRSMTGFGEAQLEQDGHVYHLELRSVNNRYFKSSVRIPDEFAFMEAALERRLRERITRGSVTMRLYVRDLSATAAADINLAAVQRYVEQLNTIDLGEHAYRIDLASLLALPGICQPHAMSEQQRQSDASRIEQLADQAIDKLIEMRTAEGESLAADLRARCAELRGGIVAIRARATLAVEMFRDRLLTRIKELISASSVQLAEQDLLKEVAVYAERSDVHEELARLTSHLDQFEQFLGSSEPAGRKLDFIAQELLRETNTIGSKAGDTEIARDVINMKAAIDRIKEQVQNAE
jgi:uncharacterized protein (TIGR00255 family)